MIEIASALQASYSFYPSYRDTKLWCKFMELCGIPGFDPNLITKSVELLMHFLLISIQIEAGKVENRLSGTFDLKAIRVSCDTLVVLAQDQDPLAVLSEDSTQHTGSPTIAHWLQILCGRTELVKVPGDHFSMNDAVNLMSTMSPIFNWINKQN